MAPRPVTPRSPAPEKHPARKRRAPKVVNLTLAVATKAKPRKERHGYYFLRDKNVRGLGLRVYNSGKKVWIYQRKQNGKPVRVVLGNFPEITLEDRFNGQVKVSGATALAADAAAKILKGLNPNYEKKEQLRKTASLLSIEALKISVIWRQYVLNRLGHPEDIEDEDGIDALDALPQHAVEDGTLPKSTADGWKKARGKLSRMALWTKPILAVKGDDLKLTYHQLQRSAKKSTSTNQGRTQAGAIMRSLRAAYNWAIKSKKLDVEEHAFETLNEILPGWYEVNARKRIVANSEGDLAKWWAAVEGLRHKSDPRAKDSFTIADYLILSLLWGGRKTETLTLKWSEVNFSSGFVSFIKTKNGVVHDIPLAPYARSILERRKAENDAKESPSEYVFPASRAGRKTKKRTHIQEPKTALGQVAEASGISFSPHDLRRTFSTLLSEQGVSSYVIERTLNHSPTDTAGKHYVHPRLKALMVVYSRLEERILSEAGVRNVKPVTREIPADQWEAFQAWHAKQPTTQKPRRKTA